MPISTPETWKNIISPARIIKLIIILTSIFFCFLVIASRPYITIVQSGSIFLQRAAASFMISLKRASSAVMVSF